MKKNSWFYRYFTADTYIEIVVLIYWLILECLLFIYKATDNRLYNPALYIYLLGCTLLFIINSILTLKLLKTAASHESMNSYDELKKITNEEKGYTNNEIETDNEFTNDNETQSIKLQENIQPNKEMMQDAVLERKGGGEKS